MEPSCAGKPAKRVEAPIFAKGINRVAHRAVDANAAWSQQLQGSYIDAVEHALGSAAGRFGRDRSESYLAGEQLRGDALCFRHTESGEAPRRQGAQNEHIGYM